MKVGDLVRNLHSETGLRGVIIKWAQSAMYDRKPVVCWQDGRVSAILPHMVELINESR